MEALSTRLMNVWWHFSSGGASRTRLLKSFATIATSVTSCSYCGKNHYTGHCDEFLRLSPDERKVVVANKSLCYNCLKAGHVSRNFHSHSSCRSCRVSLNSLLHGAINRRTDGDQPSQPKRRHLSVAATQQDPQTITNSWEQLDSGSSAWLSVLPTAIVTLGNGGPRTEIFVFLWILVQKRHSSPSH